MTPQEIFRAYVNALEQHGSVEAYPHRTLWTQVATTALVRVGLQAFPAGNGCAKGHCDPFGRSEYLALDVAITDPDTWGPPLFIAEHEQLCSKSKVQYCAWKLLSIDAQVRVLVTYFGKWTEFTDMRALDAVVSEVCSDRRGRDLLVIAADFNARPGNYRELAALHQMRAFTG